MLQIQFDRSLHNTTYNPLMKVQIRYTTGCPNKFWISNSCKIRILKLVKKIRQIEGRSAPFSYNVNKLWQFFELRLQVLSLVLNNTKKKLYRAGIKVLNILYALQLNFSSLVLLHLIALLLKSFNSLFTVSINDGWEGKSEGQEPRQQQQRQSWHQKGSKPFPFNL